MHLPPFVMDTARKRYNLFSRTSLVGLALMVACVLWELGWPLETAQYENIVMALNLATIAHLVGIIGAYVYCEEKRRPPLRLLIFQIIGCLVIFGLLVREDTLSPEKIKQGEVIRLVATIGLVLIPALVSLTHVFQWLIKRQGKPVMPPALQFVVSLICAVLAGSGLLMLPNATHGDIPYLDALFTSASAVCVTGLSSVNFAEQFTLTGQIFVLCLIQIGGLGVMTFAYFIAMIAGQGVSLRDRVLLRNIFDESNLNAAVLSVRHIVISTLFLETTGALFLYFTWKTQGVDPGSSPLWWHAMFHAVSAFCNAGFSTFPGGLGAPGLVACRLGQLVILCLITMGGLGFPLYQEAWYHFKRWLQERKSTARMRKIPWSPYSKLVLCTTSIIVFIGTLSLFLVNTDLGREMTWTERLWVCLFDSISSRTAGFAITNMEFYMPAGCLIICALMIIGGSPGGTAGGIRTTTVAVVAGEVFRVVKGRKYVQFFRRRIDQSVIERCLCTIAVCGAWVGASTVLACSFQPEGVAPLDMFFEVCSAFSTSGLSMGATSSLYDIPKCIVIINMIVGRAGLFLFLVALAGTPEPKHFHYPAVKIPLT